MDRGELAAIGTAFCWAITAMFFSGAGRRVGSRHVNRLRLVFGSTLLLGAMLVRGTAWGVPPSQAAMLALSGVIGLALGDGALFEALVLIGPRRATLLMTLAPFFAAVLMLVGTGEPLGAVAVTGMLLTLGGVAWVVSERAPAGDGSGDKHGWGVTLGVVAAFGQGAGIVLAKGGLGAAPGASRLGRVSGGVPIDPLYGTLLRMIAATVLLWGISALRGRLRETVAVCRDRRAVTLTAGGAVFGPFLGVWLSLIAVSVTNTAVATTLMGISPVLVIPLAAVFYGERITGRAVLGALVAVAGVAVLTFRDAIGGVVFT